MVANTSTRLREIMAQRGLKQADVLRMAQPYCEKYKIKMGKSDLSQFVSGKVEPGQWKLTILGLALNISEAWLMGFDVPMEREASPAPVSEEGKLCETELRLVALYRDLNHEGQEKLIDYADDLVASGKYIKSGSDGLGKEA